VITGGRFEAVVVAIAELLFVMGSGVDELTIDVLLNTVLLATERFIEPTRVVVADTPAAIEVKVTVRLLPEPAQTPPPVEEHETKVVEAGRLSVTVTSAASPGLLLATMIV
jgi:hypothetical protein